MGISRVLIANRGEIAVRVIRACRSLNLETVVVVSEADRATLAAQLADRAVCIGPAPATKSYLVIESLIAAAQGTGCDALHPGYGFLAESAALAQACLENGIVFVGPSPDSIQSMGNKLEARETVRRFGVPTVPGSKNAESIKDAAIAASEVGYPILLKAAAGGGGKGIKIVHDQKDLTVAFETAVAEARAAFGDGTVYVERYIPNARHIEVQVLGDGVGDALHLGERDCSLQRRYQKIVEEAPAHGIPQALKEGLWASAATIAKEINYSGAGTVEYIYDQDREEYFFLEMNTRIQVEHPVTETITGTDLVAQQLRIAAGEGLWAHQSEIEFSGHAIECRITAESAADNFRPSPGLIRDWVTPDNDYVRVDSHCFPGYTVPPFYDSLLAKLIVHGSDRHQAIDRMRNALAGFHVSGIDTNIPFLRHLIADTRYHDGAVNTQWIEQYSLNDFIESIRTG